MDGNKRERWCRHNADPDLCVICAETGPLKAQLAKYGWHSAGCPAFDAATCDVCNCGFEAAIGEDES